VLSAACSPVVCCCVLSSFDVVVGRRGEWACVVLAFMRTWSKWHWCVATEAGGYLLTTADVRPGHVVKWPASIVVHHVERAGD
jgi:hypothetical protein